MWLGESGENTDEWIDSFRRVLEAHNVGWCFWPYKKLDATSCITSIKPPPNWNVIVGFADGPRTTFEEVRKRRLPIDEARKILGEYLEQVKFANCRINHGYLKGLGLK